MSAAGKPAFAQSQGAKTATGLVSFGFNVDLAPNLNLPYSAGDTRSFGATSEQIATYGGAWLMGLQTNGALGCAVDFPSFTGKVELSPYRTLIQAGQLQMIMITTGVISSVDPSLPAALSRPTVTGLLRNELQFSGVVITDTLSSASVSKRFSLPQAAVMAIEAGADMINGVWDTASTRDVISALKAAIASGALTEQQVDAAVTRILALKLRYHIISTPSSAATLP
jgi:beta-N-acetylhexosaminidase